MRVSEVARVLGVEPRYVKEWAQQFRDYLTPEANPTKGTPRQFSPVDLPVLAYVAW
jgi:hypothetical protein